MLPLLGAVYGMPDGSPKNEACTLKLLLLPHFVIAASGCGVGRRGTAGTHRRGSASNGKGRILQAGVSSSPGRFNVSRRAAVGRLVRSRDNNSRCATHQAHTRAAARLDVPALDLLGCGRAGRRQDVWSARRARTGRHGTGRGVGHTYTVPYVQGEFTFPSPKGPPRGSLDVARFSREPPPRPIFGPRCAGQSRAGGAL